MHLENSHLNQELIKNWLDRSAFHEREEDVVLTAVKETGFCCKLLDNGARSMDAAVASVLDSVSSLKEKHGVAQGLSLLQNGFGKTLVKE